MSRRSAKGKVTIALDFRNPAPADNPNKETGRFADLADVLALLSVLQGLAGASCEVFFDFGVISITNVDLSAIRGRMEAAA